MDVRREVAKNRLINESQKTVVGVPELLIPVRQLKHSRMVGVGEVC